MEYSMVVTVVLLALGVFAVLNLLKAFLDIRLYPAAKLLAALVLSGSAVIPYASGVRDAVVMGAGVFGLSTLFHAAHKILSALGDERRTATLRGGLRR
jgi:hypothetical protein